MKGNYQQQMPGDKLDLQTVIFKILMDLNQTAASIWTPFADGYMVAASNYYYQVRSLIALVKPLLSEETIKNGNKVIAESCAAYEKLRDPNRHDALTGDKSDDVTDLVMFCASHLLEVVCVDLLKQGFIREQARGAIAGSGILIREGDDAEEPADIVDEE